MVRVFYVRIGIGMFYNSGILIWGQSTAVREHIFGYIKSGLLYSSSLEW